MAGCAVPRALVRTMSVTAATMSGERWQYDSRIDRHYRIACRRTLFGLLRHCPCSSTRAAGAASCFTNYFALMSSESPSSRSATFVSSILADVVPSDGATSTVTVSLRPPPVANRDSTFV
jgi:hypothetical protein